MKYAGLKKNDIANGEGVCVSLWTQGCPHRCPGCHNPDTWEFDGGFEVPATLKEDIIAAIGANGVIRNFSILGGEPLCEKNRIFVRDVIRAVRIAYPSIKIFIWTGYILDDIRANETIQEILSMVDIVIDGPFIEAKRDITLKWRGSPNQKILYRGKDF